MSPYPSKLDELVDWASLFHSLENERCILCIGPDILNPPTGERLEEQLANYLRANEKLLKISVYDDGWFHYQPGANELSPYLKVKAFYEQPHEWAEKLMALIAQIPFHFVLNFTPDYKLRDAYQSQQGLDFVFDSYKRNKPFNAALKVPTRQQPLLFNMLGELKEKDSLVMTYKDYYEYIRSVINSKSMSDDLENNIYDAEYFIFLGMPFDKWYVHLFMHILNQHVKGRTPKFSANTFINEKIGTLCDEQYTMTFVPQDIDIEMFVKTLHEKCEERGMLRTGSQTGGAEKPKPSLPFAQLREWVVQDDLDSLFDCFARNLADTQWLADSDNLEAQHQDLRRKVRRGTLNQEQQTVEANRIRDAVFELLRNLQKHFSDGPAAAQP